ncbi:hypothetical protein RI129_001166 [Pyrocoelia pectoralis]|uniref:Metalloendopeptidase n=1 Tax=Pyrocoelia pectoralis TaxID=417401 RepID=A0AAN7ZPI0_9COLE
MVYKFILVFLCAQLLQRLVSTHKSVSLDRTKPFSKFTIEQLLTINFPTRISEDVDLDPCKADSFVGDIAISKPEYSKEVLRKEQLLQEEVEQHKKEVLEGLQIEEEGLTDLMRKKTKQPSAVVPSRSYNDLIEDSVFEVPLKNGQILQSSTYDLKSKLVYNHDNKINITKTAPKRIRHRKRHTLEKGIILKIKKLEKSSTEINTNLHPILSGHEEVPTHEFEPHFDFKAKHLTVKVPDAYKVREKQHHRRFTRAATARKERIWEYGVIPYEIDGNFSGAHKALFKQAMRHWENFTCVKFVERDPMEHPNYIIFTERPCGCCSFVGKRGNGVQAISIGKNCDKFGIVVHELGHVVGFWHEHTRPDRDKHVIINRENIMNGQEYNFNKLTDEEVNSLGLTYDYDSIMHYARNTFSKGTYLDTILPIDVPGRKRPEIGQRVRLSEGDIAQTKLLYKCPKCGRTFQANSATFSSPSYVGKKITEEEKCEWRITATHGERIVLNITELDIAKSPDCRNDYVEIRDGYWYKSDLLGKYCGSGKISDPIISTGSRMLVSYISKNPSGHRGFTANYEAVCGGELSIDTGGHLESPNYPEDYQPNKECIWRITVPDDYQVALKFQSFEVENHDNCVYDYVEVRDGLTMDSPLIGVFCGYKIPADVRSSSNHLSIKFVSDSSVQKAGFSATFIKEFDECNMFDHGCAQECVNTLGGYECSCRIGYELHSDGKNCEDACGGIIDTSNGTITSPSFPDLYPPNKDCVWEIRALPKFRITLNFTHFDLEGNNIHHQQCEYDKLEIHSKSGENRLNKHGSFCGTKPPPPITSDGNALRIVFHSDTSIQKSGFAAVFFTDMDECAVNNGACQHECINTLGSYICACHNGFTLHENGRDCKEGGCKYEITAPYGQFSSPNYPDYYPSRKDCVWHFSTTPGHRIKIMFMNFEMEPHQECSYDHIVFYDGDSPEAHTLGRFCGSKLPHPIVASGNQMFLVFKSDASVQRKGFLATHSTACGGHLLAVLDRKHFYSHSKYGSGSYDNRADCDWTIESPPGYNVHLMFVTFDLEDEKDCGYDYIEIFSGLDASGASYGKFCGKSKPTDIISMQEALLIRFRSDDTVVEKGFSIAYEAIEPYESEEEV